MNRLIVVQTILISVVAIGYITDIVNLDRFGQVLVAIGISNLFISIAAWRGWKILRGDISENVPLNKQDAGEAVQVGFSKEHEQPTSKFVVKVAGMGLLTGIIGIILILLQ